MITFKQSGDEAPGSFQVQVNRSRIGFWVEAETAAEAENKFIAMAVDYRNMEELVAENGRYKVENTSKAMTIRELSRKLDELTDERENLKDAVAELQDQKRGLEEMMAKMKTEAPNPEQFSVRRIFRRW